MTPLSKLSQLLSHHRARDQESKSEHIEVLVLRRDGLGIFKKHWSVHLDQNDNPHSKMMPMMISGMVQGGQGVVLSDDPEVTAAVYQPLACMYYY